VSDFFWADTALLLPFDADVNDDSSNAVGVTSDGGAAVSATQSRFGGASLRLDGVDDYLTVADNAALDLPGDFTIEAWVYLDSGANFFPIFNVGDNATASGFLFYVSSTESLRWYSNESNIALSSTGALSLNTWHHVAAVRSGSTLTLYIDGAAVDSATHTASFSSGSLNFVGADGWNGSAVVGASGYIDDLRVTAGTARYLAAFTPPASAHPTTDGGDGVWSALASPIGAVEVAVTVTVQPDTYVELASPVGALAAYAIPQEDDPSVADVALLIQGTPPIQDASAYQHPIAALADAAVDDGESRWPGGSILLDGTGDGLSTGAGANRAALFASGDLTVEGWFYWADLTGVQYLFDYGAEGSGTFGLYVYKDSSHRIRMASYIISGVNAVTAGTWHHIALSIAGSTKRLFVDGVLVGSTTFGGSRFDLGNAPYFGIRYDSTYGLNGRMQDLRVTVGTARYTAAFDLPTSPFLVPPPDTTPNVRIALDSPIGALEVAADYSESLRIQLASPIGAPAIFVYQDFSRQITDPTARYVLRITGDPVAEIPMSSWQATVQSGRQSFLQVVIPAAADWIATLTDRQSTEQMVVYKQTTIDGLTLESEMARASLDTITVDAGPTRQTVTARGYTAAFSGYAPAATATLTGVRSSSQTIGGAVRVRADIDWNLRPGQIATDGSLTFQVAYINYFVPSTGDSYMDAGSRG